MYDEDFLFRYETTLRVIIAENILIGFLVVLASIFELHEFQAGLAFLLVVTIVSLNMIHLLNIIMKDF